jgi:hypothetical protein
MISYTYVNKSEHVDFLIVWLKRSPQGIDINTTYTPKNILVGYVLSLEGKNPHFMNSIKILRIGQDKN